MSLVAPALREQFHLSEAPPGTAGVSPALLLSILPDARAGRTRSQAYGPPGIALSRRLGLLPIQLAALMQRAR